MIGGAHPPGQVRALSRVSRLKIEAHVRGGIGQAIVDPLPQAGCTTEAKSNALPSRVGRSVLMGLDGHVLSYEAGMDCRGLSACRARHDACHMHAHFSKPHGTAQPKYFFNPVQGRACRNRLHRLLLSRSLVLGALFVWLIWCTILCED